MEPDRMLLSAIAALQVVGMAERWLRRREARETELATQATGPKSLATRIDETQAAQQAQSETVGRLSDALAEVGELASTRYSALQVRVGEMDVERRLKFQALDHDAKETRETLARVERGQSQWMRTLRHRTHSLANHINQIIVRMAMTERGVPANKLPQLKPVEMDAMDVAADGSSDDQA